MYQKVIEVLCSLLSGNGIEERPWTSHYAKERAEIKTLKAPYVGQVTGLVSGVYFPWDVPNGYIHTTCT